LADLQQDFGRPENELGECINEFAVWLDDTHSQRILHNLDIWAPFFPDFAKAVWQKTQVAAGVRFSLKFWLLAGGEACIWLHR
jgi:hypothetical protein